MIKAFLHFLGRGGIHPGALNANQGTHVAILLWRFLVFFFSIFFPLTETSLGLSWRLSSIPEGRSLPLQPPAGEGEEPLPACGKLWEARALWRLSWGRGCTSPGGGSRLGARR